MASTASLESVATPPVPPELIADIIDLTVELLIEEELHLESYVPLSNRFLLSASLVNRAWHPIATNALLQRGTIPSESVANFLAQVKARGMESTLESVRFCERVGPEQDSDAAVEDAFDLLVQSLPGITRIDLVDLSTEFEATLASSLSIHRLHLSNSGLSLQGIIGKLRYSPPTHLVVTDTRNPAPTTSARSPLTVESLAQQAATRIENYGSLEQVLSIKIKSSLVLFPSYALLLHILGQGRARLQACHLECTSAFVYSIIGPIIKFFRTVANTGVAFSFPLLTHLATHLPLAQSFIMAGNLPSLSSLKILPAPLGAVETMDTPAEDIIRELMAKLPTLAKLKVPEVWASTAVREYCEAAGVELAVD